MSTFKICYSMSLAAALFLSLTGCGPAPAAKNTNSQFVQHKTGTGVVDLTGKSTKDILNAKYDQATLTCGLWILKGQQLDLTVAPTEAVSWDLKADLTVPKTFTLSGEIPGHKYTAVLKMNAVAVWSSITYTDANGTVYKALNTPFVTYDYQAKYTTLNSSGTVQNGESASSGRVATEMTKDVPENMTVTPKTPDPSAPIDSQATIRDYVQCSIAAKIKPLYQNQLTVTPAK